VGTFLVKCMAKFFLAFFVLAFSSWLLALVPIAIGIDHCSKVTQNLKQAHTRVRDGKRLSGSFCTTEAKRSAGQPGPKGTPKGKFKIQESKNKRQKTRKNKITPTSHLHVKRNISLNAAPFDFCFLFFGVSNKRCCWNKR
jgi:hypothetical protein